MAGKPSGKMLAVLMLYAALLGGCVSENYDNPIASPPEFYKATQKPMSQQPEKVSKKKESVGEGFLGLFGKEKESRAAAYEGSSEVLLEAEGKWNLVEQTSESDPALAHMKARGEVDPKRFKKVSELSPHFTPDAKSGQDGKMRVLKLEPTGKGWERELSPGEQYRIAETAIAKPAQKVVEPETAEQMKTLFGEEKPTGKTAPIKSVTVAPEKDSEGLGEFLSSVFSGDKPENKESVYVPVQKTDQVQAGVYKSDISGIVVPPPIPAIKLKIMAQPVSLTVTPPQKPQEVIFSASPAVIPRQKPEIVARKGGEMKASPAGTQDVVSVNGVQTGKVSALGVRSGVHPGKTRIAFDFSGEVRYKVALDHIRGVLRIKFENTDWAVDEQGTMEYDSKILGSYIARPQKDGSVIFEVRIKEKASISDTMILRPGVTRNHRVVIDLQV